MRKFTLRGVNPLAFSFSEGPMVLPGTCPQASLSQTETKEPIAYSFRCVHTLPGTTTTRKTESAS
jgi:hypothetical protein